MKAFILRFTISIFVLLLPAGLFAQEKTQSYYNTHEREILPDAQSAFQRGNYERAIELCKWHYIIVGTREADSLRDKAEKCAQLSTEMNGFFAKGKISEAKVKASAILSINKDDAAAKAISLAKENPLPAQDTVVAKPPVEPIEPIISVPTEEQIIEALEEQEPEPVQAPVEEKVIVPEIVEQTQVLNTSPRQYEPRSHFVIKAGTTIIDLKHVSESLAPGVVIGMYDLGGSRFGGEIGVNICSSLSASTASLFGIDASLVVRVANNIYPKIGVGYFSCKSSEANDPTAGMCVGAGLTFLIGGHFCLEVGTKYYPEVRVHETEMVSTTPGATYEFPSIKQILLGGIAPFVSLGWAF